MASLIMDQNNFFRIVPPTPSQSQLNPMIMHNTSSYHPPPQLQPQFQPPLMAAPRQIPTPHLHPAPPNASWRSQRSSSISSIASSLSGGDGWSTTGGESDANASDSDGLGGILGQLDFGEAPAAGRMGTRRAAGKPAALSIDPNLVRPRAAAGAGGGAGTARPKGGQMQGDEEMPTAKPKKKGGEKGKASPKPKKVSHARKLNADHIPRPRNAFILFRKHVVDAKLIPASVEIRHQNVSVIVAKMWADAPPEQKEQFAELAKVEKEEHLKKYPGYRYQPVYRRTNVIRRRVRKDEAEEEKCKNVAALLLQGTSGAQLEEEIKEKMQQPHSKGSKSRKTTGANELSKGALRALRAQARQQANSESDSQSRSQSISSRAGSVESDARQEYDFGSRRSSITSDIDFGLGLDGKYDMAPMGFHPGQLAQDGYQFGMAPGTQGAGMLPGYAVDGGMQAWAPPQQQQTWAYPDQHQSDLMSSMGNFAYQQPAQVDAFFNYDQALPFSPTAHHFEQPFVFPAPAANNQVPGQGQAYNPGNIAREGYSMERGTYSEQYSQQQQAGGMKLAPYAPASAKWDANFQPGVEGLPFDEALLGDFGAALMQAEEAGVW